MNPSIRKIYKSENNKNIFLNYIAFGLQILFGFLTTIFILYYQGIEGLGVFTQLYAILVVCSQLGVLGINDSVLQKVSILSKNDNILVTALRASIINASLISIIIFNSDYFFNFFFKSEIINNNLNYLSFAIFLLIINKVFFSFINAKKWFKLFAFINFLRPLLIFFILLIFIFLDINSTKLALIFLLSELFMFVFLCFKCSNYFLYKIFIIEIRLLLSHYKFGSKVSINSVLSESFIRVDILVLGFFLNDELIGIYAFAALFFEGIYQLSIVLRNIINPDINNYFKKNKLDKIYILIKKTTIFSFIITFIGCVVTLGIFPFVLDLFDMSSLKYSYEIIKVLFIGNLLYCIIVPSENFLFIINKPLIQSYYMGTICTINILLNIIFINNFGLIGAAYATTITYGMSIIIFNIFVGKFTILKKGVFIKN